MRDHRINGIKAQEIVEKLRPVFMGRAMVRARDLAEYLNHNYPGKGFTIDQMVILFRDLEPPQDPSFMVESNDRVLVYDGVQIQELFNMKRVPDSVPEKEQAEIETVEVKYREVELTEDITIKVAIDELDEPEKAIGAESLFAFQNPRMMY